MRKVFLCLIVLMFMGGLLLVPQNEDWNTYDGVNAQGIPILASDWNEGVSVSVDLNFMPMVPNRIEPMIVTSLNPRVCNLYQETGTYGAMFDNDDYPLSYTATADAYTGDDVGDLGASFNIFFEIQYTDVESIDYDIKFYVFSTDTFDNAYITFAISNFIDHDNETLFSDYDTGNPPSCNGTGTYSLNQDHTASGIVHLLLYTIGRYNTAGKIDCWIDIDQLKLTFNNITGSLYPSEYRMKDDNSYEHRMFIESPEYRTQIASTIPDGWTFDRTIPEVDTRESGGVLYMENNTLPVTYTIFYTQIADGTTHSDSFNYFNETTADNIMFYPDAFFNDTIVQATSGTGEPSSGGSYADTYEVGGTYFRGYKNSAGTSSVWIETIAPSFIEGFEYAVYCKGGAEDDQTDFWIYNYTSSAYVNISSVSIGSYGWENGTIYDPDYWNETSLAIRFQVTSEESDAPNEANIDYAQVKFYTMHLASSEHYAEGFVDISDWTVVTGSAPTTDNDVITIPHIGDSGWDTYECDVPSSTGTKYVEWRIKWNADAGENNVLFQVDEEDDWSGATSTPFGYQATISSTWTTYKTMISQDVESIRIALMSDAADNFLIDYLRISPGNEMGLQHDCSTLEAVGAGTDCTRTTDGDKLNITGTGTGDGYFYLSLDPTTTGSRVEEDYYPFLEIKISEVHNNVPGDNKVGLPRLSAGGGSAYVPVATWFDTAGIIRMNWGAVTSDAYSLRFYVDNDDWFTIDYIKFYSIANFSTYSEHANMDANDYFYVDDGVLYCENDESNGNYMRMNWDPALDIDYTIYNIVNSTATKDGAYTDLVGYNWIDNGGILQDAWRTELTQDCSGTPYLKIDMPGSWTITDLKFWSDHTAPVFEDLSVSPLDAYNDEEVTITAIIDDVVGAYEMTMNADVYPTGFSDVDYDLVEEATDMWDYTFSTMTQGEYIFTLTATDGSNTATDTIAFTIRTIEDLSITAVSSSVGYEVTAYIETNWGNTTITIYEDDVQKDTDDEGNTLTYTKTTDPGDYDVGVKIDGTADLLWFNFTYNVGAEDELSITALTFDSSGVNVMAFVNTNWGNCTLTIYEDDVSKDTGNEGTLEYVKATSPGDYDVGIKIDGTADLIWANYTYNVPASAVLAVTDTLYTATSERNYLSGELNLGSVTWTAYDNDTQQDTGSLGAGSFSINWEKNFTAGLHEWGVSFADGTTTRWRNGTYEPDPIEILYATIGQDNDTIFISGKIISSELNLNWEVWENTGSGDVSLETGTLTLASSKVWFSLEWDKSADNVEANFTLQIDDGTNAVIIYGWYTEINSQIITYSSGAFFEGDTIEGDTTIVEGDSAFWMTMTTIFLCIVIPVLIGIAWFGGQAIKKKRKRVDHTNDKYFSPGLERQ